MDNRIYLIDLYDLYKELLTEKQRLYFEKSYFEDESLSEISESFNVSRAVVQKTIKNVLEKLEYYEGILKKYKIKEYVNNISDNKIKDDLNKLL